MKSSNLLIFVVSILLLFSITTFSQSERGIKYPNHNTVTTTSTTDKMIIINPSTREGKEITVAEYEEANKKYFLGLVVFPQLSLKTH